MQDMMKHKTVDGGYQTYLEKTIGSRGNSVDSNPLTARLDDSQNDTYRTELGRYGSTTLADRSKSVGSKIKLIKDSFHIATTPYHRMIDPTNLDESALTR